MRPHTFKVFESQFSIKAIECVFQVFLVPAKKALNIFTATSVLYAAFRHMLLKWITPIALNKMAALSSQCIMVVIVHLCAEFGVCDVLRIPWFFE